MSSNNSVSIDLKPFIDFIRQSCSRMTPEELTEFITTYACNLPAKKRKPFMEAIEAFVPSRAPAQDKAHGGQAQAHGQAIPNGQGQDPPPAWAPASPSTTTSSSSPVSVSPEPREDVVPLQTILENIAALRKAIRERAEGIEDGSIKEELDYYDNDYDYDLSYTDYDPPELMISEFRFELSHFFGVANQLFLSENLKDAYSVFKALFAIFTPAPEDEDDLEDDDTEKGELIYQHDPYIPDPTPYANFEDGNYYPGSSLREERARFCRCAYESASLKKRPEMLAEAMEITKPVSTAEFKPYQGPVPLLIDVENAGLESLSDKAAFLPAWLDLLSYYDNDRAQVLFMEAIYMQEGIDGAARLARLWKEKQPRAYLFWMHLLRDRMDWKGVIEAGAEALTAVAAAGDLRAQIARELIEAAEAADDPGRVLQGKREYFCSLPGESSLIEYLKEADRQKLIDEVLTDALTYLASLHHGNKDHRFEPLILRILLMKGDLSSIFRSVESPGEAHHVYRVEMNGALFAAVLAALAEGNVDKAAAIQLLLRENFGPKNLYSRYLGAAWTFSGNYSGNSAGNLAGNLAANFAGHFAPEADDYLLQAILRGLKAHPILTDAVRKTCLAWADSYGRARIHSIVSNQNRYDYNTAAVILCALAECYTLSGSPKQGAGIIREFRNDVYPRHSSFRKKLREIMAQSFINY
jgi:hypothetical protein